MSKLPIRGIPVGLDRCGNLVSGFITLQDETVVTPEITCDDVNRESCIEARNDDDKVNTKNMVETKCRRK